MANSLSIDLKL
jgi:hypothetical protein